MIRKGIEQDIPHIAAIYEHIHDNEECGKSTVGWILGVYPTADGGGRRGGSGGPHQQDSGAGVCRCTVALPRCTG